MTARETGVVERGDTYEIGQQFFNLLHALLGAGGYGGNARDCKLTITLPTKADASKLVERLQADARAAPPRSAIRAGNNSGYWQGVEYEIAARPQPTAAGEIVERNLGADDEALVAQAFDRYQALAAPDDAAIKWMVERFLSWRLPENFNPDNGITANRPNYASNVRWEPTGTNLLGYTQAEAMVRHMVEGLPAQDATLIEQQAATIAERDAEIEALVAAVKLARSIIQDERDVLVECHSCPPDKNATYFDPDIREDVEAMDAALAAIDATLERTRGQ